MRLFVAVDLPAQEKKRLYAAAAPLRDAGLPIHWIEPESIHLTLKFLGWVRPEDVGRTGAVMARAAAKTAPFELSLGGYGAFPSVRRPRVVWVGVGATAPLRCLKHDLEWEFAPFGYEREVRAFQPHITLGRARTEARAGDLREFGVLISALSYEAALPARRVDLMRSHPSAMDVRYERIASAGLGVAPAGGVDGGAVAR